VYVCVQADCRCSIHITQGGADCITVPVNTSLL
jgi:hypothetical protein